MRGGRDHMNLDFMNSIPAQPDATPTSLAIWLGGTRFSVNERVAKKPRLSGASVAFEADPT
jgi:hypothetical protein